MKRIFAFVLMLVLIFSFSVSAFASSHTSELDALNSIDNWSKSIWQVLTNKIAAEIDVMVDDLDLIATRNYTMLSYLLDISDFTRSTYQEIEAFTDSFFNEVSWGEPFAEVVQDSLSDLNFYSQSIASEMAEIPGTLNNINTALLTIHGLGSQGWEDYEDSWFLAVYNDVHQLKEVLASDEDLALRDSQSQNLITSSQLFFNGQSSDSSVGVNDLGALKGLSSSFFDFFSSTQNFDAASEFNQTFFYLQTSMQEGNVWFSEATYNSLVTVPMTYSRDNSNVVVTHYYQDSIDFLNSLVGGD